MDESQVVRVVDRINQHVCQQPWCDFEVKEYRGTKLVVTGSLDLSAAHIFEVWFEGGVLRVDADGVENRHLEADPCPHGG
jgi:hypothetical protein